MDSRPQRHAELLTQSARRCSTLQNTTTPVFHRPVPSPDAVHPPGFRRPSPLAAAGRRRFGVRPGGGFPLRSGACSVIRRRASRAADRPPTACSLHGGFAAARGPRRATTRFALRTPGFSRRGEGNAWPVQTGILRPRAVRPAQSGGPNAGSGHSGTLPLCKLQACVPGGIVPPSTPAAM